MAKQFRNKLEKEKYVAQFVTSLWRRGEDETQADRRRWSINLDLFAGKQAWSQDRANWASEPFIHMFAPLCRRMAESSSDIIFDQEDFLGYDALDETNLGSVRLAEIFSKLIAKYNDDARIQTLFYDFLIALGACGFGVLKVSPERRLVWTPEVILERATKAKKKFSSTTGSKVENTGLVMPEDPDELEGVIEEELSDLLDTGKITRRLGPKKRSQFFITSQVVNPLNFVWEPDCERPHESPYFIERHYKKLNELTPYFETGFFNPRRKNQVKNKTMSASANGINVNSTYEGQKLNLRDQLTDKSRFAKNILLYEYHGDIWDEDGDIIDENMHVVVAGESLVLRYEQNEEFTQGSPYILTTCSPRPFKPIGAGVADNAVDQQILTNELFGTFVDMFKLAVYPPRCYDATAIRDQEELEEDGLAPGQMVASFKNAAEAFSDIPFSGVNAAPILFQTLNYLDITSEKGAGVDVQSANPASRARISAKEIQANVARSGQSQNALARNLDENLLEPYAQRIAALLLQYALETQNLQDLAQEGVITEEEFSLLSGIPQIDRYFEAKKKIKIKVSGFRERIERMQKLGSVTEFLSAALPSMPPEALQKINFSEFLDTVFRLYGFDANKLLYQNTPADKAREENKLLLNEQMVMISDLDQHALELPAHYEAALQGATQALIEHIKQHAQALMATGQQVPQMSPEVMQALGLNPEPQAVAQPTRKRISARRLEDGSIEGEVLEGPPAA